jgi:DNA-binding transcriptional ArsR family regulator
VGPASERAFFTIVRCRLPTVGAAGRPCTQPLRAPVCGDPRLTPGNRTVTVTVRLRKGWVLAEAPSAAGDPFDALGDEHRRRILTLLGAGGKSVGEIAAELPISRPAVSRHLRLLKDARLVCEHSEGTRRVYELEGEGVAVIQEYLVDLWGEAAARFRLLADNSKDRR